MISKNKLKELSKRKYSKKIGKEAIIVIEKKSLDFINQLIRRASKKAEFSGRITIKPEDFE